jgi:hypothetical protein
MGFNMSIKENLELLSKIEDVVEAELKKGFIDTTATSGKADHADTAHNPKVRAVAENYANQKGIILEHPTEKTKVDPQHAAKIAQAYHDMPHDPNHPDVKAAYGALINETKDQFQHMKNAGLKITPIKSGQSNPYPNSKAMHDDVKHNNHLYFFPTEQGFGSGDSNPTDHPMLQPTGEYVDGHHLMANDMFRVVHDYFGHAKEGTGFGPHGEEGAWQEHSKMFSPLAQKALTTETRGQNSWVNFGPHGEANRKNPNQTVYADQKAGLMPDWTHKPVSGLGKSEEYEELEKGSLQRRMGNPKKQLQDHESKAMLDWSKEVTNREDIPEATPEAKQRFFQKLHSQTEVRKHPKTGERLFLMHRGVHPTKKDFHKQGELSSWTPKMDTAKAFAEDHVEQSKNDIMFDKNGNVDSRDPYNQALADSHSISHVSELKPKVHSAWIPESALHNYVNNAIETDEDKEWSNSSEEEYVVKPHNFTYAKKQKLSKPALVDRNINQRAKLQQVYGKDKDFAGKSRAEQEIKQFNKKIPRPEKLAASEKEIVITVFDFDNTELLKTLPTRVNEKHPDSEKPWVAKVHPDGSLVWHANNEQASKIDRQINDPRLINSFLSKVPESHRATAKALVSHVQKHPNRHFIPTNEGGNQQLRARHLLNLMKDGNNVKISTEDPNRLTIERESHSTQRQYDPIQIHYKNKGIKNEKGTGDVGVGASKSVSELRPTGNPKLGGGDVSIKKNRTQDRVASEKNIGNRIRVDLKKQEGEMPEEPKKSKGAKQEEEKVGDALSNLATDKQTTAGMNSRIYSMPSADKMKRSKLAQKTGQIPSSINIYGAHYPVVRLMDDNKTLLVHTSPYGQDGKTEQLIEKIGMQLPEHFPDAHVIEIHHPDYRHSARIMKMRNPNTIAEYLKHASENHPDENYRKHAAEAHLHLTNLNKIKKGEFTKPIHAKRTASEGFDYDKNVKGRVDKLHNYLTSLGLTPDVQDDESGRDLGSKSPTSLTINRQGDPHDQQVLHEAGHALLTPPGMNLPEYQNRIGAPGFLGKLKQTQTSGELKPMHGGGMPEQTAQHMEGGIARRAGIEPFRTPKRGKEGTAEENARDHAKQTLSDLDQGFYRFDPFTGEKELQATPDTLINAKSHKDSGLFGKIRRQLIEQRKSRANIPQEDLDDMAASEKIENDIEKMSQPRIALPKQKGISSRPDQEVYPMDMWSKKNKPSKYAGLNNSSFKNLPYKKIDVALKDDEFNPNSKRSEEAGRRIFEGLNQKSTGGLRGIFIGNEKGDKRVAFAGKGTGDYVKEHEGLHYMLNQARKKYGDKAHGAFVDSLVNKIHPMTRKYIDKALQSNSNYANMSDRGLDSIYKEEMIAMNRDIITSGPRREHFKNFVLGVDPSEFSHQNFRDHDSWAKKSWKNMVSHSKLHNFEDESVQPLAASEKDVSKPFGQHPRNWYKDKKSQEKRKIIAEKDRQKTGAKKPLDAAMDKLKDFNKSSVASSPLVPEQLETDLQQPFKSKKKSKVISEQAKGDEMNKSIKSNLAGIGLAASLAMSPMQVNKNPAQQAEVAQEREPSKPKSDFKEFGTQPEDHFLHNIMQVETSGGTNKDHPEIKYGMHKGTSAVGRFALMPKTVKEVVGRYNRSGKSHPDIDSISKMSDKQISEHINSKPEIGLELARTLAQHVLKRHGNTPHAAYAWKYGHNLSRKNMNPDKLKKDIYIRKFHSLNQGNSIQGLTPASEAFAPKTRDVAGVSKSESDIEKWEGKALKAGVLALGLAHGAHYINQDATEAAKAPESREVASNPTDPAQRAVDAGRQQADADVAQIVQRNFVKHNPYKPSHIAIKETIKSNPDLMDKYGYAVSMSKPALSELVQNHPTMGQEVGENYYSKLNQEFSGDSEKISHAWRNGIKATNVKFGLKK